MCGRFTLFAPYFDIIERFDIETAFEEHDYIPSYNSAPSQQVVALINDGTKNRLGYLLWGLILPWAKDDKIGYKMINARTETLDEKPSFRNAFQKKRCIIPADSFYDWQKKGPEKVAMRFKLKSNELFGFAGLWDSWTSPDGNVLHTCTVITTRPNSLVEKVHNRMPVILRPEDEADWLNPSIKDIDFLGNMLRPFDEGQMEVYEVSSKVNSPKNNEKSLIIPI